MAAQVYYTRVTRITWIAVAALATSVLVNVWQLRGRRPGSPPAGAASAPSAPTPAPPPPAATAPARPIPVKADPITAACPRQVATLAQRLEDAERKLEERLRPPERFDRETRTVEVEARIRPIIDKAFDGAPDAVTWDVECHGQVCRVQVVAREGVAFDWMAKLQDGRMRELAERMMFEAARPRQDPVSLEPLRAWDAYLDIVGVNVTSGFDVIDDLLARVEAAGVYEQCSRTDPTPGYLVLRFHVDADSRSINIEAGGTLATLPAGTCVVVALERAAAAVVMPPRVRGAMLFRTVQMPPEPAARQPSP